MSDKTTRRQFLGKTTAGTAALAWAGGQLYAAGAEGSPGPAETVNLGLIGCGGRGGQLADSFYRKPGNRIVAVCDVDSERMGQARERLGGEKVQMYSEFRKMLESKDVDAVIVATPGHWHVVPTIQACQAGKDVYVEKPLGTTIGEGRAAVDAARKYNRIVQIGTQQRSTEHYQRAAEIVQSGRLGEISEVKVWDYQFFYPGFGSPANCDPPPQLDWDMWVGPSPDVPYNPNRFRNHYWFFDYGGAWQLDWAVHHYDIVHWFMGVDQPVAAMAMGGNMCFEDSNTEWPDTLSGVLEYGPGPVAKKGFLMQYTFRGGCRREHRCHAKCFFGSDASMIIDRGGYTITPEANSKTEKEHFRVVGSSNHLENFLESVRNHKVPFADVEVGHYSSNPGHLLNIAWRVGRKIKWDGVNEQVPDDPTANALVTKQYRAPWSLEI